MWRSPKSDERQPPKRVGGHGHRDGHVDAHHPDVDVELELASRPAVAGEDGRAVAELVAVDELDGFLVGLAAHHGQDRAEDLVLVAVHVRSDVVDERDAQEEPVALLVEGVLAAVGHDGRTLPAATVEVGGHPVAVLLGDQRAHLCLGLGAVLDDDLGQAFLDGLDERVMDVTDGDQGGDGHAALSGAAVAGRNGGICGHADVGVGQHEHVVLGTAQRLDTLARTRPALVDLLGRGRRADERDGRDVRMLGQAADGDAVTLEDVEDTVGERRPPCISWARRIDADGSVVEGFRMNVLPVAMALPNIHMGTMAGKLKGVMPATTPRGWRIW